MASPPHLPPIQTFQPLSESGSFTPPAYLVHENNMPESPTTASAMELSHSTMIAPPPPAAMSVFREELPDGATDRQNAPAPAAPQPQSEDQDGEDGSGGGDEEDDDDDDDDEEDGEDGQQEPSFGWHPIEEDKSLPCDDELKYIESKEEHSALDHSYWEKETFFDLDDPSLIPGQSGRIDWLVEHFNGTKEKPNKELIMKSPVVRIGGYDWQIKFYPKGNRTDYLSVYLENVTMLNPEFKDRSEMSSPALPVLAGSSKITKRNSVAAQVSVVMYNPTEPRVYESKTDAHQYHKKAADFGWKYFTRSARPEFPMRNHGQRQALLRDDKLGFSAYIRVIEDPTGCKWDNDFPSTDASLAATGLRPFDSLSAEIAAVVPLLHLRPFRDLLYKHKSDNTLFVLLQTFLDKFLNRRLKRKHLKYSILPEGCDVVEIWQKISEQIQWESSSEFVASFEDLFASFRPLSLPLCDKRLSTKACSSVQQALNMTKPLNTSNTPAILTVELERQQFNKSKRKWEKLSNSVDLNDHIEYNGVPYSLYAFIKHSGPLGTNNYTPVVRPGGPGYGWYAYDSGIVKCLTQKQAMKGDSKRNPPAYGAEFGYHRPPLGDATDKDAVPYLVMYVRDDISAYTFALPDEEQWDVPEAVRKPRRAHDGTNGGDNPAKMPRDVEKNNNPAANVIDFGAFINGTPPPLPTHAQHPSELDRGGMDGDDVVMSDVEEDGNHTPVHVNTALDAAANGIAAGKREYKDLLQLPVPTRVITVNYFSGDYYRGSTLLESKVYHGQGHLIHTNGNEYKGNFVRGLPSGKGTMTYATSGNTYTGDWLDGKHHGQGVYTEFATGNVFEGGWKEGKRSGKFVLRGTVTDEDKGRCQICYEKDMTTAFYECGHVLACKECAAQIETCPVCRKRVLARLELYGVKVSME